MEPEVFSSIFLSIERLHQLVKSPLLISTAPFSSVHKLDIMLMSAIDHLRPLLQPEMVQTQSKKKELQTTIKTLTNEIHEMESTLDLKRKQLVQVRTDLESLVAKEDMKTSACKMDQMLGEIKAHLIEEIFGSSAASSVEPLSSRCQISRNGLIEIITAFEKCLQSAEKVADLDESTCWTLLKEIGIGQDKIEKIEMKLSLSGKTTNTLKPMMIEWSENLLISQILEELDGLVDAEEASRLMLTLEMISLGLKIVRPPPHWKKMKPTDGTQTENLFEMCVDDGGDQECERIVALMEHAGVFTKDTDAKDEITNQITINSLSPTQLLMRIDEILPNFPIKAVAKVPINKFLKAQKQQMFDELREYIEQMKTPKAIHDADNNHLSLFIPASSSRLPAPPPPPLSSSSLPLSSKSTTTRLIYLKTSTGLAEPPSKNQQETITRGESEVSTEANGVFEKVRQLVLELQEILVKFVENAAQTKVENEARQRSDHEALRKAQYEAQMRNEHKARMEARNEAQKKAENQARAGRLDQFFRSVFEARGKIRPDQLRTFKKCTEINKLDLSWAGIQSIPPEIGYLTSLQTFYLGSNQLSTIPAEIGYLTNLQNLHIGANRLTSVPVEIGQLNNLQILYLHSNQLTSVPAEIGHLTNLQNLCLGDGAGGNQLTSLPMEIFQLTNLQSLSLKSNRFTSVPAEISLLTGLNYLNIDGNPGLPEEFRSRSHAFFSNLKKLRTFRA